MEIIVALYRCAQRFISYVVLVLISINHSIHCLSDTLSLLALSPEPLLVFHIV